MQMLPCLWYETNPSSKSNMDIGLYSLRGKFRPVQMEHHSLFMHFSLYLFSDLELKHGEKANPSKIGEMEVWRRCVYRYAIF